MKVMKARFNIRLAKKCDNIEKNKNFTDVLITADKSILFNQNDTQAYSNICLWAQNIYIRDGGT